MKYSFKTKEEAEAYKEKHELKVMVVRWNDVFNKWVLIFDIKPCLECFRDCK